MFAFFNHCKNHPELCNKSYVPSESVQSSPLEFYLALFVVGLVTATILIVVRMYLYYQVVRARRVGNSLEVYQTQMPLRRAMNRLFWLSIAFMGLGSFWFGL